MSRFLLLLALSIGLASAKEPLKADVVVYGDASGGVISAVQVARMGKSVILVSQYGHLGGLTSSGLGFTDIGNDQILGGLAKEFYHRLYLHYQKPEAWTHESREAFPNRGQGVPALNPKTELASTFEPKVAEKVFNEMAREAGVQIIKGRIDLKQGTTKSGQRIKVLHLEDGRALAARVFIDASYEGDLLAQAGISFVVGRESNDTYQEQGNGNTGPSEKNQVVDGVDPYVVKGDPNSGLLPGVNANQGGAKGQGDHRLQAYCYRMVLTDVPDNRLPIPKPASYNAKDYEILFREIEAGRKGRFFTTDLVPNRKTDANNTGGMSGDWIGGNYGDDWSWATLNHQEREALAAKHRDYQLGLVWTLQHHPRIPETIRKESLRWGLSRDEFTDHGNWPYNLYVREARRMKSDFVMTERHCRNKIPVPEPVGMGAYNLDSHNTQRFVFKGMVKNEGDIQSYLYGKAYGISYRALVPPAEECDNLLVPWALSASHIAFGSIRMEPVFMILGQSSATAACLAIDEDLPVQKIPYEKLRNRLLEDDQRLPK
jgi:hypothetical protein